MRITDLVLGASGTPYRVTVTPGQEGNIDGGYRVSRLMNKINGDLVDITAHRAIEQGNLLALSFEMPYATADVPALWVMQNVQDYTEIDWTPIQMSFDASTFQFGALIGYGPAFSGVLQGIQAA